MSKQIIDWSEIGVEAGRAARNAIGFRPPTRHAAAAATEAANAEVERCLDTLKHYGVRRAHVHITTVGVRYKIEIATMYGESVDEWGKFNDAVQDGWSEVDLIIRRAQV